MQLAQTILRRIVFLPKVPPNVFIVVVSRRTTGRMVKRVAGAYGDAFFLCVELQHRTNTAQVPVFKISCFFSVTIQNEKY